MKTRTSHKLIFDRMMNSASFLLMSLVFSLVTLYSSAQILTVAPLSGNGPVGAMNCLTATVMNGMSPVPGAMVNFNVTGANSVNGSGVTGVNGVVTFCYQGIAFGNDLIHVTYSTQFQNATFHWFIPCNPTTTDDNDPCTIDACDPSTGIITHTNSNLVATATPHTPINCYGESTCIDVTATGGQAPLSGTGSYCNIIAGPFDQIVTDAAGCAVNAHVDVTEPLKLTVNTSAMPTPCAQNIGAVSANALGGVPGPKGYQWYDSNNVLVGSTSLVSPLPAGVYSVTVTDPNGCTTTSTAQIGIIGSVPNDPGPITGPPGFCKGQNSVTICVPNDPNATSYEWHLPLGNSGSSTTNCITFDVSTSFHGGNFCVKAKNACGSSNQVCKNFPVINTRLPRPLAINGPSPVCTNGNYNYCISSIPLAETYNWTITGNGGISPISIQSGQGTTCVVVHVPFGYNGGQTLKVNAQNCMGKSGDQTLAIKIKPIPAQPGNITGPAAVCKSQIGFYSISLVNNATTYTWSANSNVAIAGGQGTNSVAADFILSNANTAIISVVASNTCGSSIPRTKTITINPNCRMADEENVTRNVESDFNVYPNPAHNEINLDINLKSDGNCRMQIVDYSGKIVKQQQLSVQEGLNHFPIDLAGLSKGVYFLIIDSADRHDGVKILVE